MKPRGRFFLSCSLLFLYQVAIAQQIFFRPHGLSAKLPTAETYGVHQDKKGYLWIQTDLGLCRSNGRTMDWMEPKTETKTFGVYALAEDSSGQIWLATSDWRFGKRLRIDVQKLSALK
jgi:ligand-binding sensor domain-containing protein